MVHTALEAAEVLKNDGIDLEILDLRTVSPLDRDAIAQTVRKTNKVITTGTSTHALEDWRAKLQPSSTRRPSMISMGPSFALQAWIPLSLSLPRRKNIICPK